MKMSDALLKTRVLPRQMLRSMASTMDNHALARLPATHAELLRMREQGEDTRAIAAQLRIEPEAVEPLARVALAKLAALLCAETG